MTPIRNDPHAHIRSASHAGGNHTIAHWRPLAAGLARCRATHPAYHPRRPRHSPLNWTRATFSITRDCRTLRDAPNPSSHFRPPLWRRPWARRDACLQAHSHARHHHAPSAPPLPIMSRWRPLAKPLMRDSTTARHVSRTHALRRSHSPVGGIIPRPEPPMCTCGRRHAHVRRPA